MSGSTAADKLPSVPLLIGGEPIETGEWLDVLDPAAPRQVVGRVALASEALSRKAVDAAQAASERWGALEPWRRAERSEEQTSELQSQSNLVCRLLLEKKKKKQKRLT